MPVDHGPWWDHTYVTSGDGDAWGCWGKSSGGAEICSREGRVDVARCIAGPDGLAEVRYMRDGLCHQTANRILRPAGIRVDAARGCKFSFNLYGHYGRGEWRWTDCCIACDAEHLLEGHTASAPSSGLRELGARYVPEGNHREDHIRGYVDRLEHLLGSEPEQIAPTVLERAEQAVVSMAARHFDLLTSLEEQRVAPEEFYRSFIEATKDGYAGVDQALGRERFLRIFGAPPESVADLFDPNAFAESYKRR